MKKINVLIVGGGGREHALARRMMQSPQAGTIYVAPGNPGTAMLGCKNIPILPVSDSFAILAELACHLSIGLAVIGPDNALADGIAIVFTNRGIPTFGPGAASVIESSKIFAKRLMEKVGIPTAPFEVFHQAEILDAIEYVRRKNGRVVIKADGLAFGKGVRVCHDVRQAEQVITDFMFEKILGKAGENIVIEDLLEGQELSIHALCDGEHVEMFPALRDHKRLLEGDKGPMTGGMGVHGPIDIGAGLMETIRETIVLPCVGELADRGLPFVGCLYPGLMLTAEGPKVLEFNCRFGDPETQLYMSLLGDVDLIEILLACARGRLHKECLRWKNIAGACVVLATEGYGDPDPNKLVTGQTIKMDSNRVSLENDYGPLVFHAGTSWNNGNLVVSGGRVLGITKLVDRINISAVYNQIFHEQISFPGMQYRPDIGKVW